MAFHYLFRRRNKGPGSVLAKTTITTITAQAKEEEAKTTRQRHAKGDWEWACVCFFIFICICKGEETWYAKNSPRSTRKSFEWLVTQFCASSNKVRLKKNFVEFSLKCSRRWARLKTRSCWINYTEFANTYRKHVSLYPTLSFFNAWSKLQVCFDNRHTYLIKIHLEKKLNSVLHFFFLFGFHHLIFIIINAWITRQPLWQFLSF